MEVERTMSEPTMTDWLFETNDAEGGAPTSGQIIAGDCVNVLESAPPAWADLIFADPPFNIGVKYNSPFNDRRMDYDLWTYAWVDQCHRALKSAGSLWIAIGDEFVDTVLAACRRAGLYRRNWIVWHYTFGQHLSAKFGRSKTHLLYYTRKAREFTWNPDAIREQSARQRAGDKRADPRGRVPCDVWTYPRVCGTFKERVAWHPCQMPRALLRRIILATSNPGDMVLDPFAGSGTTALECQATGRRWVGIELSADYAAKAMERIRGESRPPDFPGNGQPAPALEVYGDGRAEPAPVADCLLPGLPEAMAADIAAGGSFPIGPDHQ
jgi:site-specific DNA-methyltransferase (adenine-specific)